MSSRSLAVVLLLGLSAAGRAGETLTLGGRVAAFCEQNRDKPVGDGQCAVLAIQALAAAGARGPGADDPGPGDYTWGVLVFSLKQGATGAGALGRSEALRPGDVIQFRDARFEGHGAILIDAHHTAVVAGMEDDGLTVRIYQQNVAGRPGVTDGTLHLDDLKAGWIRVYRPVPARGGDRAYAQNEFAYALVARHEARRKALAARQKALKDQGQAVAEELARQQQALAEELARQQKEIEKLLRVAFDASESELRASLKSSSTDRRFAAAFAVGERRLFWQDDLVGLLTDDDELVRQAARRSLVVLSFLKLNPEAAAAAPGKPGAAAKPNPPCDFGPSPNAPAAARAKAAERWAEWWKKQGPADLGSARTARPDTEADRLSDRLVRADGETRQTLLKQYAEASGSDYTQAIASAIPGLSGDARREAREALAERLSRKKQVVLLRYLEDEDAEVRRAAALALAMRDESESVANVARLLLDPEPSVARAAHAALRSLTGEDYGPPANATDEEAQEAVKRYTAWRPRK